MSMEPRVEAKGSGLARNVLTVPNGIALSAAAMAPVLAVVLNAPAAGPVAGAALPLSFLVAFVAALFVGNSVVEFARELPSAGSFYTFNAQGLGPAAGFLTGWLFAFGYALFALGLFTAFGSFAHDYALATFGADVPWWAMSAFAMALVLFLSIRSIRTSVQVDLTLLVIEVATFVLLAAIAIARAGPGNSAVYFTPSASPSGLAGVGFGVVFGLLSFAGFDAAATLGEEARQPRRSIPRAVAGALVAVGAFYVFVMYGMVAGYGLNNAHELRLFLKDANPFITLARRDAPWLTQIVSLVAMFGIFSCFLAVHNAVVRVIFSMGRDGVLPRALGRTHPKFRSPVAAIWATAAIAVLLGVPVAIWIGPGASGAYGFTGSIGTVLVTVVYLLSCVALIRHFGRRPGRDLLRHVVLPALGVIALAYPLWSVVQPGQYPYNLVPVVAGAWVALGVAVYAFLKARQPAKVAALGSFLAE
jgi:amino acid transporter